VQLIFFVHLDQERKPRWNLMVLLFAVLVVVIICFGSLWIMKNLNYHAPMHDNIDEQMMKNEGIYR
jgi:heme/copper-type cytochrome/quinol oxidase subunit 4